MSIKHQGTLPLCWQVKRGGTLSEPVTYRQAKRRIRILQAAGYAAEMVEILDATARHRAMINARRAA